MILYSEIIQMELMLSLWENSNNLSNNKLRRREKINLNLKNQEDLKITNHLLMSKEVSWEEKEIKKSILKNKKTRLSKR